MVNNLPAEAGAAGDEGSVPGLGRSPGGGHGNPLQYSCLENPMDRGAWWATMWRIPRTEEPGGYNPWVHKESDRTEVTLHAHMTFFYCMCV